MGGGTKSNNGPQKVPCCRTPPATLTQSRRGWRSRWSHPLRAASRPFDSLLGRHQIEGSGVAFGGSRACVCGYRPKKSHAKRGVPRFETNGFGRHIQGRALLQLPISCCRN
ncbi:hypothetical protein LY76DRAFT_203360 [Colletotrichum caudatum]|nr:hypothetical protein LY76DRAFT_203360 [Colletotrichum caudatum]